MHLDLPFASSLPERAPILVAGMGGGFDVFCGLPIYFELQRRGHPVHLASISFASLAEYRDGEWLSETLVGVVAAGQGLSGYHPERFLAQWFAEERGEQVIIWCFEPTGVQPTVENFRRLVRRLGVGAVVLVDGGVDSLTRGDEELIGSVLEDYASLAAVALLDEVPVRVLACVGMGAEGDVSHAGVLENIAAITQAGGLLGVCALLHQTRAYGLYQQAVEYAHKQPGQQPSVVNASVVSSALGYFGDYHLTDRTHGSELWISPLKSLYWCFTVEAVAARNLFFAELQRTDSAGDVFGAVYETRERMTMRPAARIPLS